MWLLSVCHALPDKDLSSAVACFQKLNANMQFMGHALVASCNDWCCIARLTHQLELLLLSYWTLPLLVQGPHVDSVVQDKRLLLGQGPAEGPSVEGAREMFAYLCQYLTSLEAEVQAHMGRVSVLRSILHTMLLCSVQVIALLRNLACH